MRTHHTKNEENACMAIKFGIVTQGTMAPEEWRWQGWRMIGPVCPLTLPTPEPMSSQSHRRLLRTVGRLARLLRDEEFFGMNEVHAKGKVEG
jgi:hypothetical protein